MSSYKAKPVIQKDVYWPYNWQMWKGRSFVEKRSHLVRLIIGLNCLNPSLSYINDNHEVTVMNRIKTISVATATATGMAILAVTNVAQAFDMGNMMKPGEWFDNDNDHRRYGRDYGGYGPYGYGGGPYGYGGYPGYGGYGGYPGYGGYGGHPGYGGYGGHPGYGGYGQQRTIVVNPSSGAEQVATPPRLPE
jgi:hypothetical protein